MITVKNCPFSMRVTLALGVAACLTFVGVTWSCLNAAQFKEEVCSQHPEALLAFPLSAGNVSVIAVASRENARFGERLCSLVRQGTLLEMHAVGWLGPFLRGKCPGVVWRGVSTIGDGWVERRDLAQFLPPSDRSSWVVSLASLPLHNDSEFRALQLAHLADEGLVLLRESAEFDLLLMNLSFRPDHVASALLRDSSDDSFLPVVWRKRTRAMHTHWLSSSYWVSYHAPPPVSPRDYCCVFALDSSVITQAIAYDWSNGVLEPSDVLFRYVVLEEENGELDERKTIRVRNSTFWSREELLLRAALHYFSNANFCTWVYQVSANVTLNRHFWHFQNFRPRGLSQGLHAFGVVPYFWGLNRNTIEYLMSKVLPSPSLIQSALHSNPITFTNVSKWALGEGFNCLAMADFEKIYRTRCWIFGNNIRNCLYKALPSDSTTDVQACRFPEALEHLRVVIQNTIDDYENKKTFPREYPFEK